MVITEKQRDYLKSLLFGRIIPEGLGIPDDLDELSRQECSELISLLLLQPMKAINLGVPDGRYAIPAGRRNGKMVFHFYIVKTSIERKSQYMMQLFGAPGQFRREKMPKPTQSTIATILRSDPALYSQMFGKEHGICGMCGSPLTDPESIARGIGPICLSKSGW